MSESPEKRFVKNLTTAFGKWKIDSEVAGMYVKKLSKWNLREDQWTTVLSRIIADFEDFPTLAQIYPYLKTAAASGNRKASSEPIWQLFTLNGMRYCRKISDPAYPPSLPAGATDDRIAIPQVLQEMRDYQPISGEEARAAFESGWKLKNSLPCPKPEKFGLIVPKVIADYDDSVDSPPF